MYTAIVLLTLLSGSVAGRDPKVIPVCELFKNLEQYDGRLVAIRGGYDRTMHGSALIGNECSTPSNPKYVIPGTPPSLWLATPEDAEDMGARAPGYQIDSQGSQELIRLSKIDPATPATDIVVTVVGQLTVFREFKPKKTPDGGYIGNAYGFYGRYPAILIIRTVKDVVVHSVSHERRDHLRDALSPDFVTS